MSEDRWTEEEHWTEEERYHEMELEAERMRGTCEACPHALRTGPSVYLLCTKDNCYTPKDSRHECKWRPTR